MNLNPPRTDWFFPIEKAPLLAVVTLNGVARDLRVPHKKALVAADTGDIVLSKHHHDRHRLAPAPRATLPPRPPQPRTPRRSLAAGF
jgi:hypothetical protein